MGGIRKLKRKKAAWKIKRFLAYEKECKEGFKEGGNDLITQ